MNFSFFRSFALSIENNSSRTRLQFHKLPRGLIDYYRKCFESNIWFRNQTISSLWNSENIMRNVRASSHRHTNGQMLRYRIFDTWFYWLLVEVEFDIDSIESWQSAEMKTSKQTRKTTPVSFAKRLSTFWNWNKHGSTQVYHLIVMRFHSAIRRHNFEFELASWRWLGLTPHGDNIRRSISMLIFCLTQMHGKHENNFNISELLLQLSFGLVSRSIWSIWWCFLALQINKFYGVYFINNILCMKKQDELRHRVENRDPICQIN